MNIERDMIAAGQRVDALIKWLRDPTPETLEAYKALLTTHRLQGLLSAEDAAASFAHVESLSTNRLRRQIVNS